MPKKTKNTKGEAKGPQGKGKANGQAKANGKVEAKLPGSYARFKGDFLCFIKGKYPEKSSKSTHGPAGIFS